MKEFSLEFLPWYQAGVPMVRCGGDDGCGSIIMEGDAELHRKWHQTCIGHPDALPTPNYLGTQHTLGVPQGRIIAKPDPGCSACGRDRACGGPRDCTRM